jgi:hypothetical protein
MSSPTAAKNAASSELRSKLTESGSLLGALDAITRGRPFALLVMTFLGCTLISAVFGGIAAALIEQSGVIAGIVGFLGMVIVAITALVGLNGAGILLADDVWERPQRGIKDALLVSLFTSHRLIVILLLEGLLFLAYLVVLAIILFLCKIPGVGPVLYALIYPLGAILTGFVLFGLIYVAIPLAAPAVWNGATVMNAIAMLKEVVSHRLLFVVVMALLLGLLLAVAGGIIAGIVGSGAAMTLGFSASIIGASMDMGSLFGMFSGYGRSDSGYVWALGFGSATLFLIATTPVILVGMKGSAIIHRTAINGLSLAEAEEEIARRMNEVKQHAQEAKEQAKAKIAAAQAAAAQAAANANSDPAQDTTPPTEPARLSCPSCGTVIGEHDMFCGNCGHKLK